MPRKLKPAKSFRETNHRCCANCKYFVEGDGTPGCFGCLKGDVFWGEWSALEPEFHICDRHVRVEKESE